MTYNPDIHQRHSIRLKDYDYSQAGAYFVTICAWQREYLFGEIVNGEMVLNDVGRIIVDEWDRTPEMRSNVGLDVYSIMPNHFHAIILIHDNAVGAHCMRPDSEMRPDYRIEMIDTENGRAHIGGGNRAYVGAERQGACNAPLRRQSGSLGSIVAGFKSATTKRINKFRNNTGCPVWQRNYYERVIRNENELFRAREYIVGNPMKWDMDKENPNNNR